jgi:polyhydroxyalkanoate synthesis regulator phasin
MADKAQSPDAAPAVDETPAAAPPTPPKRSPGHRGQDVRDTMAEMAARAQEISQEAGSKMASAMKDVINAAAGLAGFAVESARDLVQYMVRRGQMTQEEADKLLRDAEDAYAKRKPAVSLPSAEAAPARVEPRAEARSEAPAPKAEPAPAKKKVAPAIKEAREPAAKEPATKEAAAKKSAPKTAAKAPAAAKGAAAKGASKPAAKAPAKSAAKAPAAAKKVTAKKR